MTMKSVDLPHLRSVVLAGHAGAGKTTLAEQLMFKAGAIPRLGKVDDEQAQAILKTWYEGTYGKANSVGKPS